MSAGYWIFSLHSTWCVLRQTAPPLTLKMISGFKKRWVAVKQQFSTCNLCLLFVFSLKKKTTCSQSYSLKVPQILFFFHILSLMDLACGEWVSWWWSYVSPRRWLNFPGSVSPLRGCRVASAVHPLQGQLGTSVAQAQEEGSVWPLLQTTGAMDPNTLTLDVMTEKGGRSDFSTALASAMGISVATTVDDVDTGWLDQTVTRESLWVRQIDIGNVKKK